MTTRAPAVLIINITHVSVNECLKRILRGTSSQFNFILNTNWSTFERSVSRGILGLILWLARIFSQIHTFWLPFDHECALVRYSGTSGSTIANRFYLWIYACHKVHKSYKQSNQNCVNIFFSTKSPFPSFFCLITCVFLSHIVSNQARQLKFCTSSYIISSCHSFTVSFTFSLKNFNHCFA